MPRMMVITNEDLPEVDRERVANAIRLLRGVEQVILNKPTETPAAKGVDHIGDTLRAIWDTWPQARRGTLDLAVQTWLSSVASVQPDGLARLQRAAVNYLNSQGVREGVCFSLKRFLEGEWKSWETLKPHPGERRYY